MNSKIEDFFSKGANDKGEILNMGWLPHADMKMKTNIITFYQLCKFSTIKKKNNLRYLGNYVRKTLFKPPNNRISTQILFYNPKDYEILKSTLKRNNYIEYAVYDLDDIPEATDAEILASRLPC